jgi:hypothetical protein
VKTKPGENIKTIWRLFECEKGRRWSEVVRASYYPNNDNLRISKDGDFCCFSGCLENDHGIKAVKDTDSPPFDWFRAWEPWTTSPVHLSLTKES